MGGGCTCLPVSNHACYGCNNLLFVILGFPLFSFCYPSQQTFSIMRGCWASMYWWGF
ncbi:hypothetical protein BDV27DRAFT_133038 [Aspergillus caelatus]|uniref:Uncharacterized protein n=1 Tax=Aspergillus caelatus TaxID=61420 RepID=A0A5N6ZVV6_9EURO|nr:uncharacterized protein BDV27DRAFT_133038 [Aspergillus caelatus]KAE8361413.1 hypothetical protein BDV27DRAFT_133038 [Aspergillus caelatus]